MPSRSSDPLDDQLSAATERIRADVLALGRANPVVIIDGRSGAGKSSLAARLVRAWPLGEHVQLLALDALYPGWAGLESGSQIVRERVLEPHRQGRIGRWRRWDWERAHAAEAHAVDPALGLIVEGCGALTPASAALADLTVWVDGPADSRRLRALARDGEGLRSHWEMWAAQEDDHIARDAPRDLAHVTIWVP